MDGNEPDEDVKYVNTDAVNPSNVQESQPITGEKKRKKKPLKAEPTNPSLRHEKFQDGRTLRGRTPKSSNKCGSIALPINETENRTEVKPKRVLFDKSGNGKPKRRKTEAKSVELNPPEQKKVAVIATTSDLLKETFSKTVQTSSDIDLPAIATSTAPIKKMVDQALQTTSFIFCRPKWPLGIAKPQVSFHCCVRRDYK